MFNVESLQEYMKATIPPMTGDEYTFFEKNEIIKAYEGDKNFQTTLCEPLEAEPGLLFHEFILLLGRIAWNCISTSETIGGKLTDFFIEKLNFKAVADGDRPILSYDEVAKKLCLSDDEGIMSDEDEGAWDSEEEMDE